MNILTNWVFWIIIAAIVFVLAIIGYLSESKKKNKKAEDDNLSSNSDNVIPTEGTNPTSVNVEQPAVNTPMTDSYYNVTPEINSASVSQSSNVISDSSLGSEVFAAPVETMPAVETPASSPVEALPAVEAPVSAPVEAVPAVETPVAAPVEAMPAVETPVAAPVEAVPAVETPVAAPVIDNSAVIEPASVFTANIDQVVSSTPTPIPAEPIPAVTPTPIPSTNAEIKADNLSTETSDNIETL